MSAANEGIHIMKVVDLMDRLQPGMFYQRMGMQGYGDTRKPLLITGYVVNHVLTDGDAVTFVATTEFDNRDTYTLNITQVMWEPEQEMMLLAYAPDSIVREIDQAGAVGSKSYESAKEAYRKASDKVDQMVAIVSKAAVITTREALANLTAAGVGYEVIEMPLAVQEYLDEEPTS